MLGLPMWALYVGLPLWGWVALQVYYGQKTSGPAPGLSYVTGPMGAGKSYFLVREIEDALGHGRVVISNVRLKPDAFRRMARHNLLPSLLAGGFKRYAATLESRYRYVSNIEEAVAHRLPCRCPSSFVDAAGRCHGDSAGAHLPPREGDGLLAWDEGQDQLWNRDWNDPDVKAQRKRLLKIMTRLRKMGWSCLLASQHRDNTEKQLRNIATWEVKLRNQRELVRVLGVRLLPLPLFVAAYCEAQAAENTRPAYGKRYLLRWHRKLYSTMDLTYGAAADEDPDGLPPIYLPRRPGRRAVPREGGAGAPLGDTAPLYAERPPVTATSPDSYAIRARSVSDSG